MASTGGKSYGLLRKHFITNAIRSEVEVTLNLLTITNTELSQVTIVLKRSFHELKLKPNQESVHYVGVNLTRTLQSY